MPNILEACKNMDRCLFISKGGRRNTVNLNTQSHLHLPAALWGFVKLAASPLHKLLQMRQMTALQRTMAATQVVPHIIQQ